MSSRSRQVGRPIEALRFDAGSLSLNLVATVGRRYGERVERLDSPLRLGEWLAGVGLTVDDRLGESDLARVRSLREHLDRLFRSTIGGRRPAAGALEQINDALAAAPQLRASGSAVRLARPAGGRTFAAVLALIAADAARIVASGDVGDLRTCEADDCRMLYLARGRRIRRWCSSERCGNRSRVAAHRSRTAGSDRR